MTATKPYTPWVGAVEAAKHLPGANHKTIARLGARGVLSVQRIPSARAKFYLPEVLRLAQGMTRLATEAQDQ